MQQQYYSGFSFVPMHDAKKHLWFVYKQYSQHEHLYPLFDSVLNKEVLDTHYIVAIHKSVTSTIVPITKAVVNDLEYARDAVALFFRETADTFINLVFVERNLRILLRSINNFKEVQQKLDDDLANLLSSHDFTGSHKTNSEDIANMIDVLQQMCKGIQVCISRLLEFTGQLPATGKYRQPVSMARYCVKNLVEGLQKWCRMQESITYQLQGWRSVRVVHERQEVLN
jgi:hypothetical protein